MNLVLQEQELALQSSGAVTNQDAVHMPPVELGILGHSDEAHAHLQTTIETMIKHVAGEFLW